MKYPETVSLRLLVISLLVVILAACSNRDLSSNFDVGPTATPVPLPEVVEPCYTVTDLNPIEDAYAAFEGRYTLPAVIAENAPGEALSDLQVMRVSGDAINIRAVVVDLRERTFPLCAEPARQALLAYMDAALLPYETAMRGETEQALAEMQAADALRQAYLDALAAQSPPAP
ncbi:MAG: hypothetical protein IT326_09560 [Anaerolineae bacterium]|nr:hypothetical protein [Anaerolineae bacterium]